MNLTHLRLPKYLVTEATGILPNAVVGGAGVPASAVSQIAADLSTTVSAFSNAFNSEYSYHWLGTSVSDSVMRGCQVGLDDNDDHVTSTYTPNTIVAIPFLLANSCKLLGAAIPTLNSAAGASNARIQIGIYSSNVTNFKSYPQNLLAQFYFNTATTASNKKELGASSCITLSQGLYWMSHTIVGNASFYAHKGRNVSMILGRNNSGGSGNQSWSHGVQCSLAAGDDHPATWNVGATAITQLGTTGIPLAFLILSSPSASP